MNRIARIVVALMAVAFAFSAKAEPRKSFIPTKFVLTVYDASGNPTVTTKKITNKYILNNAVKMTIDGFSETYVPVTMECAGYTYKFYLHTAESSLTLKFTSPRTGGQFDFFVTKPLQSGEYTDETWDYNRGGWGDQLTVSEWADFSIMNAVSPTVATGISFNGQSIGSSGYSRLVGSYFGDDYASYKQVASGTVTLEMRSLLTGQVVPFKNNMSYSERIELPCVGNWVICEHGDPTQYPSLLYNDYHGDGLSLLYASNLTTGEYADNPHPLLFQQAFKYNPTNVLVWTEWKFNQDSYGLPYAKINGETVCYGHGTTHIIDYNVGTATNWYYDASTKLYTTRFTMSIDVVTSGKSGGACEFRCWFGASTYDAAEPNARASFIGDQSSCPRFKVTCPKWRNDPILVYDGS